MAVIKLGGGVTDMRGSIGGNTFSRGPAGPYVRARVKPINPRSNRQAVVRAYLSYLSQFWGKTMDPAVREAWEVYAADTNFKNKVADTIQVSGLSCSIRCNSLLLLAGQPMFDSAPIVGGHAEHILHGVSAIATDQTVTIDPPVSGFDPSLDGDVMIWFQGRTMGPGRKKSPQGFRYQGCAVGNEALPFSFPVVGATAYPFEEGDHLPFETIHVSPDGRTSVRNPFLCTAVA